MSEDENDVGSLVEIDEESLCARVKIIKEQLNEISLKLREKIDSTLSEQELIRDETFKTWIITNLILSGSISDKSNSAFNRMLYYLYDKTRGNIYEMINQYGLDIKKNEDGSLAFDLMAMEIEYADEET